MAWPVYSTRFIHKYGPAGGILYTVPAGKRAVIKNVTVYNGDTAAANCVLTLNGQGVWAASVPGPSGGRSENVMIVANEGEGFLFYTYGPNMGGSVSGYLLDVSGELLEIQGEVVTELPAALDRRESGA